MSPLSWSGGGGAEGRQFQLCTHGWGPTRCPTRLRSARCSFSFSFRPSSRENSTIGRWEEKHPSWHPLQGSQGAPRFLFPLPSRTQGAAFLCRPA